MADTGARATPAEQQDPITDQALASAAGAEPPSVDEAGAATAAASEETAVGVAARLNSLAAEAAMEAAVRESDSVSLGWILDHLHERAFGIFLLVLSLPVCIPFLYGIPQVVAVPMLVIAAQMAVGRRSPWLPAKLAARSVKVESLADLARRAGPYLLFFEKLCRPRLVFITMPPTERIVGAFLVVFCISILIPLPATNTVPGIAVGIASIGLLQRDGLVTLGGVILGAAWIVFLISISTVVVEAVSGLFA
ncbi:MAG: exopolysaccharide biosynthesis protein [Pseudomonadota bacterium]